MSKSTFFVRSSVNTQLGEVFDSLEMARSAEFRPAIPAYIEEYQDSNLTSKPICHSFYPPPQPTPPRAGIVDDITQSAAWKRCCAQVARKIEHHSLTTLVGLALSQPHESVLEDYCESVANTVFKENMNLWAAVLPQTDSPQANLCIVNELEGFARAELRRALVAMRGSLEDAISICDRME